MRHGESLSQLTLTLINGHFTGDMEKVYRAKAELLHVLSGNEGENTYAKKAKLHTQMYKAFSDSLVYYTIKLLEKTYEDPKIQEDYQNRLRSSVLEFSAITIKAKILMPEGYMNNLHKIWQEGGHKHMQSLQNFITQYWKYYAIRRKNIMKPKPVTSQELN